MHTCMEQGKGVIGKNCAPGASGVTSHDPAEVYDLWTDPGESKPLRSESERARAAVAAAERGRAALLLSLDSEPVFYGNQLESMARPWLFPCCKRPGSVSGQYTLLFLSLLSFPLRYPTLLLPLLLFSTFLYFSLLYSS